MSHVNLFTHYKKKEDHFTNGLVSILQLSKIDDKDFVRNFFKKNIPFSNDQHDIDTFKTQVEIPGTRADAEFSSNDICCLMETKIVHYAIDEKQIRSYLNFLKESQKNIKKFVLLTPDDSSSQYVQGFTQCDLNNTIHLEWKKVYDFLHHYAEGHKGLLSEIIRQYSEKIRDEILKKDIAGVIAKIKFGDKSEVYSDKYLKEMKDGKRTGWNTPRKYRELDGKHRRLLLYDPEEKAITVEVEISKVIQTNEEDFPWSNEFAPGTLKVYRNPIRIANIQKIEGLDKLCAMRGSHKNLTHEQYQQLTG